MQERPSPPSGKQFPTLHTGSRRRILGGLGRSGAAMPEVPTAPTVDTAVYLVSQ